MQAWKGFQHYLVDPSLAAQHLGATFVQEELPGWLLLCGLLLLSLPLQLNLVEEKFLKTRGSFFSKLGSQCSCTA